MSPPRRLPVLLALLVLPAAAALPSGEGPRAGKGPGAGRAAALPSAPANDSVEALVERARELRQRDPAGAASLYRRAAREAEAGVAAWIRLSEAQAAARAGDTATVGAAARRLAGWPAIPRDSVRLALARAALEAGDAARGAELGRSLDGAADPSLWAGRLGPALLAAGDTAAARRGLLAAAEADPDAGAGDVLLALEPDWRTLVRLARADREGGRPVRAVRLLARALEAAPAGDRPGIWEERAGAELAAGRASASHRSASRGLEVVRDPETRAELELLAARTHFARGQAGQAEVHLRRGLEAGDGEPSARAGYLLADLALDRGRTVEARERYRRVAERLPGTRHGGIARMRLGLLAFREGRNARAVEHFRAYLRARPRGGWATASVYWEGRALAAAGRAGAAEARLRTAVERDPMSWYGIRAAHRVGTEPLAAALSDSASAGAGGAGDASPSGPGGRRHRGRDVGARGGGEADRGTRSPLPPTAGILLERMDRLRRLGWTERALAEWGAAGVDSLSGGRPLELAARLNEAGWTAPGIRLGWSVFERRGRWSRPLARAIWPLPHRDAVLAAARRHSIPPALVAAVARQESGFDPRAISRAGAVGLMQIMPATARELGGVSPEPGALMEPGVSLELGAGYLGELLARFDGSVLGALAAYNAGPTRWRRWRRFPEADVDPELLVERIPFGETRRYVKAVLRNVYLYARLHGLEDGGRPPASPTG